MTLLQVEYDLPQVVAVSVEFLQLLHARQELVNETITLALNDYHDFSLSHGHKQRPNGVIVQHSCMLSRTAMNKDVEKLRERHNHLALLDSAHNKTIHLNSKHIATFEQQMHDIAFYAKALQSFLNKVLTNHKNLYELNVSGQAMSSSGECSKPAS